MTNSRGSSKLFIATHRLLIYQTLVIVAVVIWSIKPNIFLISSNPWGSFVDIFHHHKKGGSERISMDTYFISHGSPTLAIEDLPARHFLKNWQNQFPQKPKAILVISAHWDTAVPHINLVERNSTIYDFYGFPDEMYNLQYNAPGAPNLAKRVKELLLNAGFKTVNHDFQRGLDHGAWVPLSLMYPDADIPVCQLSIQSRRSGAYHYEMGRALAPLRSEGILIIGSGSATHNLRELYTNGSPPAAWALEFDKWLTESLINGRFDDVNHFVDMISYARVAHPYPDHFYPLNVALGAAGEGAKAEQIHKSWSHGTLSYSSYAFKPTQ